MLIMKDISDSTVFSSIVAAKPADLTASAILNQTQTPEGTNPDSSTPKNNRASITSWRTKVDRSIDFAALRDKL